MRGCNQTITVFNARYDAETGDDVYIGTVISGASWFGSLTSAITNSGLSAVNVYTVRIPKDADTEGKQYVNPIQYAQSDPSTTFTLREGDIVVKGAVQTVNPLPATLQKQHSDMFTILGITDSTHAANAPHWKVVGK